MPDQTCDCCGADAGEPSTEPSTTDRWIDGASPADAPLPESVATAFARSIDATATDTLADYVAALRRKTGGGALAVEDLCHVDGPADHWGTVDGERYDFRCFYDAVVLARLVDEPVEIHTESPGGTTIEAHATGDGAITSTPPDAAMSFGVASDASPPAESGPTHEHVYAATCPYVKAFPSREAYAAWAAAVPAETIGVPLEAGADFAALFVE